MSKKDLKALNTKLSQIKELIDDEDLRKKLIDKTLTAYQDKIISGTVKGEPTGAKRIVAKRGEVTNLIGSKKVRPIVIKVSEEEFNTLQTTAKAQKMSVSFLVTKLTRDIITENAQL